MAREFVSSFARVYPQASYSVVPINRGQSLDLGFHLQRCYQSARLLSGASGAASDDDWARFVTECHVVESGGEDGVLFPKMGGR